MAEYARSLMQRPVEEGAWLLEEASTSTRENALYSLDMLRYAAVVVAVVGHHGTSVTIIGRCMRVA